jgi:hypothetical protein
LKTTSTRFCMVFIRSTEVPQRRQESLPKMNFDAFVAVHESGRVQGFGRRPDTDDATCAGAVVRKPSGKEPAGGGSRRWRTRYGDFDAVFEDAGTDEMADGVIVRRRVAGDKARDGRQQERDGDLSFAGLAGYRLGRAWRWPALNRRDRSIMRRRMRLRGLMRYRS